MAKGPKISIAEQLASIAAASSQPTVSRDHVATPSREGVDSDALFKEPSPKPVDRKVDRVAPTPKPSSNSTTLPRGLVNTRKRGNVNDEGMKVRQRIEKPHASLYAHPRVFKKIREIAAAEDCKPHDLFVQGLRLMLASYGYDLDKIERGED